MQPLSAYDLKALRVAIIDDNPHMLDLGMTMLKGLGVREILSEENGDRALSNGTLEEADILVLDWLRQPLPCEEFLRCVRDQSASPNPFIPIILMRGFIQDFHVWLARDLGMTEFLKLPISASRLYERIVRVIERPRPFINAPNFFGPDRRRHVNEEHDSDERRVSQPTLIDRMKNSGPEPVFGEVG